MNAEEIRNLAIDRIVEKVFLSCSTSNEPKGMEPTYRVWAAEYVDALGDLLPTAVEEQSIEVVRWGSNLPARTYPPQTRYVTEWRGDDDA